MRVLCAVDDTLTPALSQRERGPIFGQTDRAMNGFARLLMVSIRGQGAEKLRPFPEGDVPGRAIVAVNLMIYQTLSTSPKASLPSSTSSYCSLP